MVCDMKREHDWERRDFTDVSHPSPEKKDIGGPRASSPAVYGGVPYLPADIGAPNQLIKSTFSLPRRSHPVNWP